MLLSGRGLWLMLHRHIGPFRSVWVRSSLPAVNYEQQTSVFSVEKMNSHGVPPDWFLPGPTGLRGPLLNDVRLSLRPPLR